ncbi:MAG TPA: GNAT family N-acetyltransferase [Acidobacteria bacterium]|nr:GNAT family N-acetyltransferase [Acidobacteriota bacterium]
MRADEIPLAVSWAAAEGWNPGLADAQCFAAAAGDGFLVGEIDGKPAAIISLVNYDDQFAFLGFYIVRPELRGQGLGLQIWQEALRHAGTRVIGLDGVVAQQANYRKSGFQLSHNNIRYGGVPAWRGTEGETVALSDIPREMIVAEDSRVFPAERAAFWEAWLDAPDHKGRALLRDGQLAGWGVIRPSRTGRKVGPLVAGDRKSADAVLSALIGEEEGEVFLDVPQPNAEAVTLATSYGLVPVFETARMYTGPVKPIALERIFGVTTFELG